MATIKFNDAALEKVLEKSDVLDKMTKKKAEQINALALQIFQTKQVWANEDRISDTTPPKYIERFRTIRVARFRGVTWRAVNTDPGAIWVEFGATAGGRTQVLRYRPFGEALDRVGDMNA